MNTQNFISKHLYQRSWISISLLPISYLYSIILKLRRLFYHSLKIGYRSDLFIISIGNIVSGGSGKTPTTIFLANLLKNSGFKIVVLHRGYKGNFEKENKIISNNNEIFDFAKDAGDEAFLLANKLPNIPIIVGRNRVKSLELIKENFPKVEIVILDDSFQHLKVQHDFDFLIYNSIGNIGNGFVLPSGILRESLSAQKYADFTIINGEKSTLLEKSITTEFSYAKYKIDKFFDCFNKEISLEELQGKRIALLSGIGVPESFENTVLTHSLTFGNHFRLPDHYDYQKQDLLVSIKKKCMDIDYLLTTEKDYAKLQFIDHGLPLVIVSVSFNIENSAYILSKLKKALKNRA